MQFRSSPAFYFVILLQSGGNSRTCAMRFKTFGDLDAPEWILSQIITMFVAIFFLSS
jgi:hypothetical protein